MTTTTTTRTYYRAPRARRRTAEQLAARVLPSSRTELASEAASLRAFGVVLDTRCVRHDARRGEPCWAIERDRARPSMAVCAERITRSFPGRLARGEH